MKPALPDHTGPSVGLRAAYTASEAAYDFIPVLYTYRVEVSGWNPNQAFFVEKSKLQSREASGTYIELISAIPDGAVVFLRVLPSLSVHRSDPVGYQTEFVETTPEGRHQFRLHAVYPRANRFSVSDRTVVIH